MYLKFNHPDQFIERHIGPNVVETEKMLATIGVDSLEALINQTVPKHIRLEHGLLIDPPMTEPQLLRHLKQLANRNKVYKSYIGTGYYNCYVPGVIQRNILENPGWYTQYTPYQAEIAQGRLEALLNFQTMICDLTGMAIANASLLDEATAAAEAMIMAYHVAQDKKQSDVFYVMESAHPQTIALINTRAEPLGIQVKYFEDITAVPQDGFGYYIQYPDTYGEINDYQAYTEAFQAAGGIVIFGTDLLALTMLTPPGEFGADIVVGSAQRFGVPMGYGGPHAAFFACKDDYKRLIPGRIVGVSVDSRGKPALRLALQTREQHIRREKATSNICTAQVLLAIMSSMYAVYHGPRQLFAIAERTHRLTKLLALALKKLGYYLPIDHYFDTLYVVPVDNANIKSDNIRILSESAQFNFRYIDRGEECAIGISLDETTTFDEIEQIVKIFAKASSEPLEQDLDLRELASHLKLDWPESLIRKSAYLQHPVFNSYHSETEMLRYIKKLESRDLSLAFSMIPLGSCTMKLNATAEMIPVTWRGYSLLHPFVPQDQAQGYRLIFNSLEKMLCSITGFAACSLQPNSGAQGEYTGLMVIRAYQKDNGQGHRNIALIPSSAHGTNPASAVMAGLKVVVVKCDDKGNIDLDDLSKKAFEHRDNLSCLMVTYPSTHGVFEEYIQEICAIIHKNGGLVYMDGANMNAQVGLTSPARIGADVNHINLHKTFCIPHGGGGPGMGPICVNSKLAPYLPGHPLVQTGGKKSMGTVSAAPYGSSSILLISYAYMLMMGNHGLTEATKMAILNANYIKARLEKYYPVLYQGIHGRVAHELILDLRHFKHTANIDVEDVAKRLIDYGYHAPTVSFPVAGTMMIEPTESESLAELDRFCDAMIAIYHEIKAVETGAADKNDNVLKNAPHTADMVASSNWSHSYSREQAVYPAPYLYEHKFWPAVGRVNNIHGDRNLICACLPVEAYAQ